MCFLPGLPFLEADNFCLVSSLSTAPFLGEGFPLCFCEFFFFASSECDLPVKGVDLPVRDLD